MNLFLNYQKKFLDHLISLKKKKIIDLPDNLKSLMVELPPKGHNADMSCNAAMILAKNINKNPRVIAEQLKEILLKEIKDF